MHTDIKQNIRNRLRRIEGQIRGLQKMVEEEQYCIDIITQTSAVRNSLGAVEDLMLENHLTTHVKEQMRGKDAKKAAQEVLSVYKLAKKK